MDDPLIGPALKEPHVGDFEDTFGAGADASEIIDGYANERRREDRREGWRLAKLLGRPFRRKEKPLSSALRAPDPFALTDEQQAARRRAIEIAKQAQAQREAAAAERRLEDEAAAEWERQDAEDRAKRRATPE